MKLVELLELIDESSYVTVVSAETGEIIATYTGKDSIPKGLNPCVVLKIRGNYGIEIEI